MDERRALHRTLVARRLSPGGSADVVAGVCWLAAVAPPPAGETPCLPLAHAAATAA